MSCVKKMIYSSVIRTPYLYLFIVFCKACPWKEEDGIQEKEQSGDIQGGAEAVGTLVHCMTVLFLWCIYIVHSFTQFSRLFRMQQEREQRHKMKKMRNQPPDPGILETPMEDPLGVSKFDPVPADFNVAGTCMYTCSCTPLVTVKHNI